jgi:hypothetical protein
MSVYSDADIDEAIERIAGDVERRFAQPEFHGPAIAALLDELRSMEAARRSGDRAEAQRVAACAAPVLETYRPTNATSRAKAVLTEVVAELSAPLSP